MILEGRPNVFHHNTVCTHHVSSQLKITDIVRYNIMRQVRISIIKPVQTEILAPSSSIDLSVDMSWSLWIEITRSFLKEHSKQCI